MKICIAPLVELGPRNLRQTFHIHPAYLLGHINIIKPHHLLHPLLLPTTPTSKTRLQSTRRSTCMHRHAQMILKRHRLIVYPPFVRQSQLLVRPRRLRLQRLRRRRVEAQMSEFRFERSVDGSVSAHLIPFCYAQGSAGLAGEVFD
ncbi:hypothetical protein M3J09_010311 [Ascochyta lentis]